MTKKEKAPARRGAARGAGDEESTLTDSSPPSKPWQQKFCDQKSDNFIDRYGHRHSPAVLKNWSPQMLRFMGIRRPDDGGDHD